MNDKMMLTIKLTACAVMAMIGAVLMQVLMQSHWSALWLIGLSFAFVTAAAISFRSWWNA